MFNYRKNLFGTARLAVNEAASLLLEAAKHWNEFGGELADRDEGEIVADTTKSAFSAHFL